jgi:hypothetical protein
MFENNYEKHQYILYMELFLSDRKWILIGMYMNIKSNKKSPKVISDFFLHISKVYEYSSHRIRSHRRIDCQRN